MHALLKTLSARMTVQAMKRECIFELSCQSNIVPAPLNTVSSAPGISRMISLQYVSNEEVVGWNENNLYWNQKGKCQIIIILTDDDDLFSVSPP